ncbi:HEAT repeat domain-containing protein [Pedobacter sp. MC2016-14]|uniref:M1 family aminopeptidase n=1 Tax=Pedobacter sp. MC2016-14 TaxID=2897327 RepID=UPI001E2CDB22|nr:M1 family aminopeptidase [Pedobacter sp. MC2016-14]MCD0490125.1 HEAT repeat domain-containing protein [Pedobacter sp. MC2016-14]
MNKNLKKTAWCACFALALLGSDVSAQTEKSSAAYRATATKVNALVHTRLDVKFDYAKRYLYGKEWVTLKPYAYATDSLTLDAKGMDIKTVALVNGTALQNLKYKYDGLQVKIQLGKKFLPGQAYTIYIDYTSKPDELEAKGSAAITGAKGLYFINPDSTTKGKPVQIWTQGETESSSTWFPTIDKPNQKTTSEISMTVPSKYVTLSNGKLFKQVKNTNSTRTDTWKMELPHAPYLFMMAVGNFKIYRDKYKEKEVNYYLEPAYAPYAKQIFGTTPEMITFYSKILGVDYPWNKYSQIVARDYVSGAMENTTATLHGEYVQRTAREMLDENFSQAESTIAHELFHQWFGDYVTAESWSNLTVNESFANYSEVLWAAHKYGQDEADAHNYHDMDNYLGSNKDALKNLVRFHYSDKEDMFDLVSYQKGGRILNMMRNFLGDEVFFKGLNLYLKQNAFKTGEAHQLRLAMEEASGKDMSWFFNQWYFNSGHPIVTIEYAWDEANKTQKVILKQTQAGKLFILPMAVDVYLGKNKQRYQITLTDSVQTFSFLSPSKPSLVNVDADKVILWEKTDAKPLSEYVQQYANAPLYLDRLEAIQQGAKNKKTPEGLNLLIAALNDKFYGLRAAALDSLDLSDTQTAALAMPIIQKMAATDPNTTVQATAINVIAGNKNEADLPLFRKALTSKSYAVQGAGLQALALLKPEEALLAAKDLEKDNRKALTEAILMIYARFGTEQNLPFIANKFAGMGAQEKVSLLPAYLGMAAKANSTPELQKAIEEAKTLGLKYKQYGIDKYVINLLTQLKQQSAAGKTNAAAIDAAIAEINK